MKTEKILSAIALTGFIFKMFYIPGGSMLLVFSLSILAIIYFPLSFYFFSDKKIKTQNIGLSIAAGFFLSLVPIGIMFKVQYWPGYNLYLIVAFISSAIFACIAYFLKTKASENLTTYYKQFFLRTLVLTIVSGFFCFIPMQTLVQIQNWRDPEFGRLKIQAFENPQNEQYQKELNDYWDKKDGIK